jgi:hypothetical protein
MSHEQRDDKAGSASRTPLSDSLDLSTLDSNDIRAWRTLARQLEERIACIAEFDAESITHSAERDHVSVPRELTAENGAKAALMGEFFFYPYEGREPVIVPWDTIKAIHRAVVKLFAASPSASGDRSNG